MLCAQLDQARAAVEKRLRQTRDLPAGAGGGVDVENGVKANGDYGCPACFIARLRQRLPRPSLSARSDP